MNGGGPLDGSGQGATELSLNPSRLLVTCERIAAELGYGTREIPDYFRDLIDGIIDQYPELCNLRAGYRIVDSVILENRPDGIHVGDRFFNLRKIIAYQLRKAERVAVFTCTIGPGMEEWAARLFAEGDEVKGHLVDTVASVAVERATDLLHDMIAERMARTGLSVTNRFSPGYCGWPVVEQHVLFSFLPEGFCGVTVTDSALMLPKKTTSGIIGIGTEVRREPYFCDRCSRRECAFRERRGSGTADSGRPLHERRN